ncbi:Hypp9542 [Branchiostoma lanceolatum]|uniref:Hypp9542 protein n=1 Tax=Branchiostoma lanceolatum TaxID=7740 RepID=A0A8S4MN91_BRALA|nr:Hypp9542 [Branchiostoma lanceolatum]
MTHTTLGGKCKGGWNTVRNGSCLNTVNMSRRGFSYPPDDDSPNLRNDDISDASSAESPTENASAVFNGPREGSGQPSSPHGHTGALPPTRVPMTPAPENRREKQTNGRVPTPQTLPMNRSQAHGRLLQQILDNQQEILKRVAKVEHHLEDLQTSKQRREEKQNKPTVPNDVRSLVKEGYDHCVSTGGRAKWNLAKGMKANSVPNDETTKAILGYVQGLMSDYTDKIHTVKAAVDTYFDSKRREEMRTKAGKIEKHRKQCNRNTRIATKLDHRLKALQAKQSYTKQTKMKLQRVLIKDYMSSDESDTDDNGEKIFLSKAIPWQSDLFAKYKRELDTKFEKFIQTDQAKRQSIKRLPGPPSTSKSKKPILSEKDAWVAK